MATATGRRLSAKLTGNEKGGYNHAATSALTPMREERRNFKLCCAEFATAQYEKNLTSPLSTQVWLTDPQHWTLRT